MDNYNPNINNEQNNNQQHNMNNPNNNNYNNNGYNNQNNNYDNNGYNNQNNNYNNNGYNNQNNNYDNNRYNNPPKDNLSLFSLLFGIASVLSSMLYYIGIPLGITAIVLSILSRNRKGRFEGKAVAGLCIGIAGIVLGLMLFATMLAMFNSPELINEIQSIYNTL